MQQTPTSPVVYTIITVLVAAIWVGLLFFVIWGAEYNRQHRWLGRVLGAIGLVLVLGGHYYALFVTPPEREMGDVFRIIYSHVPAAWMALMALTLNFIFSVAYLVKKSPKMDALGETTAEVGLMFGIINVTLGSIWAKPTWGVWWTWDPRLTTAAIMLVAYAGYLALRRLVDDPDKRATWSAVAGIVAAVDLPIVWFAVKWNSIHPLQSSPETMSDPQMKLSLRWNAVAYLFLLMSFVLHRYHIAREAHEAEVSVPEPAGAKVTA